MPASWGRLNRTSNPGRAGTVPPCQVEGRALLRKEEEWRRQFRAFIRRSRAELRAIRCELKALVDATQFGPRC